MCPKHLAVFVHILLYSDPILIMLCNVFYDMILYNIIFFFTIAVMLLSYFLFASLIPSLHHE